MRTDNLEKVFERTLTIEHSDLKPERSARREQNRKASARRPGLLKIVAERKWLDALEERGYLDPFRPRELRRRVRGDRDVPRGFAGKIPITFFERPPLRSAPDTGSDHIGRA